MNRTPSAKLHPKQPEKEIRVSVAFASDIGRVRHNNEDALVVADLAKGAPTFANGELINWHIGDRGMLLCVADGMGGANAGEVAARMAVEMLPSAFAEQSAGSAAERLKNAIKSVNSEIAQAGRKDPDHQGMGTAVTAAFIDDWLAIIAQVGDSRGYLIRDGEAHQVTRDQSMVQSLMDAGVLTPKQAALSPYRNVILQALGTEDEIEPSLTEIDLEPNDYLILCTDGLSNKISPEEIKEALGQPGTHYDACLKMVDLANQRGGEDNITVIAAQLY
jgi:protein phosphatase